MNMMRTKQFLLAAVMGLSALGFTACSDSEVAAPGVLTVDQTYVTQGVETGVESAIIEVPVTSNGRWFAVVDSCDWLAVMRSDTPIHEGNGVVKLKVDENRTGVGRKGKLSVVDFNHHLIEIPVYQNNMYRGEVPTNGTVATFFSNNQVGCGVDYNYVMEPRSGRTGNFVPTKMSKRNNIFNMTTLESLQRGDGQLYRMSEIDQTELHDLLLANSISKSEHLGVKLEMACSFGFIEFQGKGDYSSSLEDNSDHVNYSICRNLPVLQCSFDVPTIASVANENLTKHLLEARRDSMLWQDYKSEQDPDFKELYYELIKEEQKPSFNDMFSRGFQDAIWNLYCAYYFKENLYPKDPVKQEANLQAALEDLDDKYGPFFIAGGQFGGSINLYALVDRKDLTDSTSFNANITANISSIFELSGDAKFTSLGQQLYKNSDITLQIYGGTSSETANEIVSLLGGKDLARTDLLAGILNKWVKSLAEFDRTTGTATPKQADPIMFSISPVWQLVSNAVIAKVLRDYFMKKYADRGIATWVNFLEGDKKTIDVESLLKDLNKSGKK